MSGRMGQTHSGVGYEALRIAIYRQAMFDWKSGHVSKNVLEKFFLSGAYQIDSEAGRKIVSRLREEAHDNSV